MCTREQLNDITERIAKEAKNVFGSKLDSVILYGSYARGEETSESDIDIMVLANVPGDELSKYKQSFISLSAELGLMYDVVITVMLKDIYTFNRYIDAIPFYSNVKRDGIKIDV